MAWYGALARPAERSHAEASDRYRALAEVPVLGLYGGADQGIPGKTVDDMRAALRKARAARTSSSIEDAPHGFNADYRPSFRKDAATDGWKRMLAWFKIARSGLRSREKSSVAERSPCFGTSAGILVA